MKKIFRFFFGSPKPKVPAPANPEILKLIDEIKETDQKIKKYEAEIERLKKITG